MKKDFWTTALLGITIVLVLGLCFLPVGGYTASSVSPGEAGDAGTAPTTPQAMLPQAQVGAAEAGTPQVAAAGAGGPARRPGQVNNAAAEEEDPSGEAVPAAEEEAEDAPYAAAWTSPAPGNFTVTYTVRSPDHTAYCTWNAVTNPVPYRYRVHKWDQDDYGTVYYCYQRLVTYEPAAGPYFTDFEQRVDTMLNSPGLTNAERQAMLDAIEVDLDAMNGIMCASTNPSVASLLTQMKNAATRTDRTVTNYSDNRCNDDYFYWYSVVTRSSSADTSPLSHTEVIFAVRADTTRPAVPTGVTAKAYDPGVFVEWSRNTESDLAGYNVYRVNGTNWTQLNPSLITVGTEYYHADGTAGQVFGVRAVDMSNNVSNNSATATAVLQPATTYLATDPGWTTTGTWEVEYYTLLPPPDTGPADLLVAQDAGAMASHAFTGRRVKLYVSTYWSCGEAQVIIDGQVQATVSMSGGETPTWGKHVFTISGLSKGSHTFALKSLGSGGSQGYNFVNVQYIEVR